MLTQIEEMLMSLVYTLPLEVFVVIGSIVEEIIAPIPSSAVMVLAGSFAKAQEYTLLMLLPLSLLGALGKTIGGLVVYAISDRGEDFVMHRFGKLFNVTHEEVEAFGKKLGNGFKDYLLMTLFRILPFVPSVVVSVGSGLLKVPLPVFIVSTFLGTIVRDGLYLYAGYVGAQALVAIINESTHMELYVEIGIGVLVGLFILYRIFKKKS